ncbi:MAG: FtsQ-type POTRA domain-containing protein [Myxococcaceae bacterium]
MILRSKRNRRRIDVAKKTGELKAAAKEHAPWVLKVFGLMIAFVAIGFGANEGWNWARTSPRFALHDVNVKGQVEATDVELVRLGGVLLGQNLFAMDTAAMERAIAAHPWIKSVRVTRHFPSRLSIDVEEHRAVAALSLGELYLVNENAEPFKRLKAGDRFDLPLVTGIDRDAFASKKDEATRTLKTALELIDATSKDLALSEVNVHPEGMTVFTSSGLQIEFGEGDLAAKLARLARVQKELRTRSMVAEVIHLDNRARPSWVAVKVKAPGSDAGGKSAAKLP